VLYLYIDAYNAENFVKIAQTILFMGNFPNVDGFEAVISDFHTDKCDI